MKRMLPLILLLAGLLLLSESAPVASAPVGMKVFVQWAEASPDDWVLMQSSVWGNRAAKADIGGADIDQVDGSSIGDQFLNNQDGWVFALNIQGVHFSTYDHFAIEDLTDGSGGIVVYAIADDPWWYPAGWRYMHIWTFLPPEFDPRVGQINTRQTRVICLEPDAYQQYLGWGFAPPDIQPWGTCAQPPSEILKHGIYLSEAKSAEHQAARTFHGWREWTQ